MRRGRQAILGAATLALVGVGSMAAVQLTGHAPEPRALAAGWALAAANAGAVWVLNRWALTGPASNFVRRAAVGLAVRIPFLIGGLGALLKLTSLQSQSIFVAFFGGYFGAMVWEVALLYRGVNGPNRT